MKTRGLAGLAIGLGVACLVRRRRSRKLAVPERTERILAIRRAGQHFLSA
jgi:hypothetical protein